MLFEITHTTAYRYADPAIEAYLETRLTPPESPWQHVSRHEICVEPPLEMSSYVDAFGNLANFFSLTLRHDRLAITNRLAVETSAPELPAEALGVTVAEARQLFGSVMIDYFDYVQATREVPLGGRANEWVTRHLGPGRALGEALSSLNESIYRSFRYEPGSTDNLTPLSKVWKQRKGVCQDFAHVMLSVLRTAGLPCRYVCGYIETEPPPVDRGRGGRGNLIGAVATHAWVEVLVPGLRWVALDPTNNQWCAEQHVAVSFGRNSGDAAPVRGTFKGSGKQAMKVRVKMKRVAEGKV